jgi:hypothetical protein
MGIVILDFDGPIFPQKIHLYPQNQGEFSEVKCKKLDLHPYVKYWYADPFAIAILNELKKEFNYKLVISSSWADDHLHKKNHIEALLNENGLIYDIHDDWRTPRNKTKNRNEQIEEWLENHPEIFNNYIVLDDIISAPELYFEKTYLNSKLLKKNVFLANERDGYNYDQFDEMRFLMSKWL